MPYLTAIRSIISNSLPDALRLSNLQLARVCRPDKALAVIRQQSFKGDCFQHYCFPVRCLQRINTYHDINHLLSRLISGPTPPRQTYFASTSSSTSELAYQVGFPRLEIVLGGESTDGDVVDAPTTLQSYDTLLVPAGGRNFPQQLTLITTLSILFGKQQLGFSIVQWDGKQY